tara:strand:- start:627 stop:1199 length:573 start_codon:yes stop_codon:yes gene_type:complete
MTGFRGAAVAPVLDARTAAFLVFSVGFLLAMAAGLAADDAEYARAKYTIWPVVALGGWAVALMLRYGLGDALDETAWRVWWAWGLVAYVVHLYWGYGVIFAGDVEAVYTGQGTVVASANFALFFLWAASVIAAFARWPAAWLHGLTALLFAVSTLVASILFGRDISPVGGAIILVVWLAAIYLRQPDMSD